MVGLVGESLLRRKLAHRCKLLCLLRRRARADHGAYGGLARTLGWHYLRGREQKAPPPQAIAATVVAIDGLISCAVGSTILVGLLGRTYDSKVGFDALVAKNLVYFFGHSIANLSIYLGAAAIYVLVPRYAGRSYEASKVFVAGWMGSLVFIATAYSHHLYMDFVQPAWADIISAIASYGALLPVAVITIYSMTMLIWGSRYHWTLASTLLYIGFTGWAIGGVGAVIDSLIPINFRLHNTTWVVAHFHTYLILTVVVWALAFLAHLLERDADRTSSRARSYVDSGADPRRRLRTDGHLVRRGRPRCPPPLRNSAPRNEQLQPGRRCVRAPFRSSAFSPSSSSLSRWGELLGHAATTSWSTSIAGPALTINTASRSCSQAPRPAEASRLPAEAYRLRARRNWASESLPASSVSPPSSPRSSMPLK